MAVRDVAASRVRAIRKKRQAEVAEAKEQVTEEARQGFYAGLPASAPGKDRARRERAIREKHRDLLTGQA